MKRCFELWALLTKHVITCRSQLTADINLALQLMSRLPNNYSQLSSVWHVWHVWHVDLLIVLQRTVYTSIFLNTNETLNFSMPSCKAFEAERQQQRVWRAAIMFLCLMFCSLGRNWGTAGRKQRRTKEKKAEKDFCFEKRKLVMLWRLTYLSFVSTNIVWFVRSH